MYHSQYYTCEQIDQRLLQGYLDDYNTGNGTNLSKEQFIHLLYNTFSKFNLLAKGYLYNGIAIPSTNPGRPDGLVFYIAVKAGTYVNFGSTEVTEGITILKYNGESWVKEQVLFIDYDIFVTQKRLEIYENLSPNIICAQTALDNCDINNDGIIIPYDRRVSDYIYCKDQTHISGTYKDSRIAFYDRYRNFISVASEESGVVEVPTTAYFARIVFSHYRNNDYFIFGNNQYLTLEDYVPYGAQYLKDYIDNSKETALNYHRNEYVYNSFYFDAEHSSNNDRLYINIPANVPFKVNVNCEELNGRLSCACYIRYSDNTEDLVESIPISKTEYKTCVKSKDIASIGFYIYEPSVRHVKVFSSVTIIKETIPYYWLNHLYAKMGYIHANDEDTAFNGDMFIFFTDYHIEQNSGLSHELIKYIINRTNVDKVIFGGDAYNGGVTREIALEKLRIMKERFASLNVIGIRGNHDYNLNDGGSSEEMLTESEIFANISDKYKRTGVIRPSKDVMYGYLDNEEIKLRYIFLDSKYENGDHDIIDDTQLDWMASKMSELDSSWTMLIFSHQFRQENGDYMPSGRKIADKINQTNYSATLAAIIYGHAHSDFYHNDLGYLDICTTCDSKQEEESWGLGTGTINEHAFDVFAINLQNRTIKAIRIGRHGEDVDREWTY